MGPLLMTGFACLGATVAVGLVASSHDRARNPAESLAGRRLAIIVIAFVTGSGVLGVVIGLLAVVFGEVRDPSAGLLAAAPAVLGAVIGLALLIRRAGQIERATSVIGALYIAGLGILGVVVAILAATITEIGRPPPPDWPFVILGPVTAAAAIAMARSGGASLHALAGTDETRADAIVRRQISRCVPFQVVIVGCAAIAIFLVATSL